MPLRVHEMLRESDESDVMLRTLELRCVAEEKEFRVMSLEDLGEKACSVPTCATPLKDIATVFVQGLNMARLYTY
ncbi:unnamed protein product [Toxocara canis]|uniref:Uncharacterized protein n=1 Tax=Toxocara canis TaxID=6265 RepID=A0A183UZA6_TOXCA|nr:unnamed protein product [Toxocara canis]